MKTLLTLKNIDLAFEQVCVFTDLNLTLADNNIVVVKTGVLDGGTSLLNLCNATLQPQQGDVLYGDQLSANLTEKDLFNRVGMQFESEGLLSMYTVLENCKLPLSFHTLLADQQITERIVSLAEEFEFGHFIDKYPYQLNDVQLRLANLLRLLVIAPKIFLLDEIQSGMSEKLRNNLLEKLITYMKNKQRSMVMTITAGDEDYFADQKYLIFNHNLLEY